MVETVRTADELINSLFASGQLPHSINEQDVRDAVVSICLETTDLSSLPRSPAGLPVGRLWIDQNLAIRVVTAFQPANMVGNIAMRGAGRFVAEAHLPGVQLIGAVATFNGAGGGSFSGTFRQGNSGLASPAGSGLVVPTPVRRLVGSQEMDGSGLLVPTAKQRMRATRTIGGAGSLVASGTVGTGSIMTWAAAPNAVLSNGNLNFANGFGEFDVIWVATTGNKFKSSGRWYVELHSFPRAADMSYGIANPSINKADDLGVDENSWALKDNWDGTGYDLYNGNTTYFTEVSPPAENSTVSIAIDCNNWKWWCRLDGGAWGPQDGNTQNPSSAQGGMDIPTNLRTGGVSVAGSIQNGENSIDMYPSAATWIYSPPSGFIAM